MTRRIALLWIATALALPLGGCGDHLATRVPSIVGLKLRDAEQRLFSDHLRWRIAPDSQTYSQPLPANEHTSMDDIPVTGQQPAAGTATKPNAVITISTPCTSTHPCA